MSTASSAAGVLALLAVLAAVSLVAVALRRRLVPSWRGAQARLVELLLGHVAAVVVSLVLGTVGVLGRPALLVAWGVLAAAAAVSLRRPVVPRPAPVPVDEPRWLQALAGVAVLAVLSQWLSVVPQTLRTGVLAVDAVHYHLTFAALFVRTGSTTAVHRLNAPDPTTGYPLDDELLQGTAMALLGADTHVVGWQLLALAGALLAAWVAGRAWGSGCLAVLATCVLLTLTGSAVGDANDWAATWPLVAAVAVLAVGHAPVGHGPAGRLTDGAVLLVGLAVGLAAGTKLTVLLPAAVLVVAAWWGAGSRLRASALLAGALLAAGGYWYVRSLVALGTPLPRVTGLEDVTASVLSYLDDGTVVREWFRPGLRFVLGSAWPLLLLLPLAGLVRAAARPERSGRRTAAAAGLASAAGYLVTPTSAGGPPGQPFLFVYNVRYALVALLLGLVLLSTSAPARRVPAATAAALLALLVTTLLRDGAWPEGVAPSAVAGALAVGTGLVVLVRVRPRTRFAVVGLAAALVAAVAVPVQDRYLDRRYGDVDDPRQALFVAVRDASPAAVGVVGFPRLYPLMGPDWSTPVRYLGRTRDGAFVDARTCTELLDAAGATDVVVVQRQNALTPFPPARRWLSAATGATQLYDGELGTVFALADDAACG